MSYNFQMSSGKFRREMDTDDFSQTDLIVEHERSQKQQYLAAKRSNYARKKRQIRNQILANRLLVSKQATSPADNPHDQPADQPNESTNKSNSDDDWETKEF